MSKNAVVYKRDLLMVSLTDFYCNNNTIDELLPVINGTSVISLRIIDWFVTNYAKKYNTSYIPTNSTKQFMVYLNYKSQLKAYSKKQFDPFCRRDRIAFYYNKDNEIETTVGQLNFFRWAIQNDILNYIKNNIGIIENDMNTTVRMLYGKNNKVIDKDNILDTIDIIESVSTCETTRRKRQELSISATKKVNKHSINIIVQFE